MKILLVDDSHTVRTELARALKAHDFQVTETENGLEALSQLKRSRYDYIISDYKMPFLDGFKLAENVIRDFSYQPQQILILTTDTSEKVKYFLRQLKLEWLAKPVNFRNVLAQLNKYRSQAVA